MSGAETKVNFTPQAVDKFWASVMKTPTCWLWQPRPNDQGYGVPKIGGVSVYAHRVAYFLTRGRIPDDLQLDHVCRVRHCVNPDHLEPVTQRVNGLRGISPQAVNARKSHCDHGHEFTPENTYRPPAGGRRCRACFRDHDARRAPRRRTRKGKAI